jgi:hypothetical protein
VEGDGNAELLPLREAASYCETVKPELRSGQPKVAATPRPYGDNYFRGATICSCRFGLVANTLWRRDVAATFKPASEFGWTSFPAVAALTLRGWSGADDWPA